MPVLKKISSHFGRTADESPNTDLAKELVKTKDTSAIKELVENLWNKDIKIRYDCILVLFEIGYTNPELIADYAEKFIKLISDEKNRMVWGAMIALSTIAALKADTLWDNLNDIIAAIDNGSVTTIDFGVKTLAGIASAKQEYNKKIFPMLIEKLKNCKPKTVPTYAESIYIAVNDNNEDEFFGVIKDRKADLSSSQMTRLKKFLKKIK